MAKQTEIAYEPTKEWADYQTGGTRIDAADLNNMEGGIADACAAVDQLRTKRLPTYLVATGGDEATQDVYQEAILGPCLIVDLATATTYYDNGEDGEGHERTKLTSGADIDDLRDSLSQCLRYTSGTQEETFDLNTVTSNGTYSFWDPTNSPVGAGWVCLIVIQMSNNPNYCVQLAMSQSNSMFMRLETDGSWGEWVEL